MIFPGNRNTNTDRESETGPNSSITKSMYSSVARNRQSTVLYSFVEGVLAEFQVF